MPGEVGFDRDLARIDWQLELRPLFCSFWRHRVPPLRSHLLTPILNLRLAGEQFGRLAITLLLRDPSFFFWRGSSLFDRIKCGVVQETVNVSVRIAQPVYRPGIPREL